MFLWALWITPADWLNLRRMLWEPPIYSWLVRSAGDNLDTPEDWTLNLWTMRQSPGSVKIELSCKIPSSWCLENCLVVWRNPQSPHSHTGIGDQDVWVGNPEGSWGFPLVQNLSPPGAASGSVHIFHRLCLLTHPVGFRCDPKPYFTLALFPSRDMTASVAAKWLSFHVLE